MAFYPKQRGTSETAFKIGFTKIDLDTSNIISPWTWTFPATPGTAGYVLQTDGTGVLSWAAVGAAADSTVPTLINIGESFTVHVNRQALFTLPITVDGDLVIDGYLIQV